MHAPELEQTLVLIKPDALKNSLTGYVLSQLSEFHSGLRFAATKVVHVTYMLAEAHYAEHRGKIFYKELLRYLSGQIHYPDKPIKQRVIAIIYQGPKAVEKVREIVGPTNPHRAREEKPGCIRSLGTVVPLQDETGKVIGERMDNLIHASASVAEAENEIKLWFKPNDMPPLMRIFATKQSKDFVFYKGNRIFKDYQEGSICVVAPSDIAWASDLDALYELLNGRQAAVSLQAVVAKYLSNDERV